MTSDQKARMGGVILGIGLGGFADGIILHQILQWHHMLSSIMPPADMDTMAVNMRWDGFFHLFVWILTIIGVYIIWSAGRGQGKFPPAIWFTGWMIFGWGLFNFVEGIINHHIFGLHHVRYAGDVYGAEPSLLWGLGFVLIGGLGFMAIGWLITRSKR